MTVLNGCVNSGNLAKAKTTLLLLQLEPSIFSMNIEICDLNKLYDEMT